MVKCSDSQIREFQAELRAFREWLHYSEAELEARLGYNSRGYYIKRLEGYYGELLPPSARFLQRLRRFKARRPGPKPQPDPELLAFVRQTVIPWLRAREGANSLPMISRRWVRGRKRQ